jgi:hypothetical protein
MGRHILVVMTNAVEGKEQEFNDWYSNVHLGEVVAIPGFISAQRYKLADSEIAGENEYDYLAIYEIEAESVDVALKGLQAARPNLNMSDALADKRALFAYTPIGDTVSV